MNLSFYIPTRMITGVGCVRAEAERFAAFGSRCLLVTGATSAKKCGALDDVTAALQSVGVAYTVYDGIRQNPTLASCMEAAKLAHACGAAFIVGIGGGSPLDAAKAIAVLAANPGMDKETLYSLKWPNAPLKVVAVGTTAGTGSEVTPVAVITTDGRKKSFRTDEMYPALALGDPTYTASLSEDFTKSTAADALAHSLESYFNRNANDASKAFAAQSVRTLLPVFRKIAQTGVVGLNADDRAALYNGSIYAGMAISITGTAFPHAMGYFLSEDHGIAHGTACAVYLTAFLRHNASVMPALTAEFYATVGTTEAEMLKLLQVMTPECAVKVSQAEREALHSRWVNNKSIAKTWGDFSPEAADALIAALFG